jgi:hypothetical protein
MVGMVWVFSKNFLDHARVSAQCLQVIPSTFSSA